MARRRFRGDDPHAVRLARDLATAGMREREITLELVGQFPELPESRVRSIAALEVERHDRLDRVSDTNWGRFQDMPGLLQCSPGTTQVRVSAAIHWTDPDTGEGHTFGSTQVVAMGRRVSDMLTHVAEAIVVSATAHGYQPRIPARINRGNLGSLSIHYIDCV